MAEPIKDYIITEHARMEMERRGLSRAVLDRVLAAPEQRSLVRPGREVLQSKIGFTGLDYLVRVLVDVDRQPQEVVTVYRTSKISKYWRSAP